MKHTLGRGIFAVAALLVMSCKTYRPNQEIRETLAKHGQGKTPREFPTPLIPIAPVVTDDLPPADSLIIRKFNLPSEVARYDRSCVLMQRSGEADVLIKDYKIDQPIDLEPFETYTLTVELFRDNELVFSNVDCEVSRSFDANLGRNIFTVPVCNRVSGGANVTACSNG